MSNLKKTELQKRAVIYTRVSTEDQKLHGFSLQDQHQRLIEYCKKNDFEIIQHYQDDHSAKTFNRPAFNQFLKDVETRKIKIDHFICIRPDRFSRNIELTIPMLKRFNELKIKFWTLENHIDLNSPESLLPFYIQHLLPDIENKRKGIMVTDGMRRALKSGKWQWQAPRGYKNNKLTKELEIDEEMSHYVIEAFNMVSSGAYAADDVRKQLIKKGFRKMAKQTFMNMLRNTIYYGEIRINANEEEEEQYSIGIHEPLITRELFLNVQNVLIGKRRNFPSKVTQNENLPLRGQLLCHQCGNKLTGSGSKSRNKTKHYYYHCQRGCNERFRADTANNEFASYLSTFEIKGEVLELYKEILNDVFKNDEEGSTKRKKELEAKLVVFESRKKSIANKFADDQISYKDYNEMKKNYDYEEDEVKNQLQAMKTQETSFKKYLDFGLPFLFNLKQHYINSDLHTKGRLVGSIFPEKLVFSENKYRTTKTNALLELLTNNINGLGGYKKRKADISVGLSSMALPSGLEPETP